MSTDGLLAVGASSSSSSRSVIEKSSTPSPSRSWLNTVLPSQLGCAGSAHDGLHSAEFHCAEFAAPVAVDGVRPASAQYSAVIRDRNSDVLRVDEICSALST